MSRHHRHSPHEHTQFKWCRGLPTFPDCHEPSYGHVRCRDCETVHKMGLEESGPPWAWELGAAPVTESLLTDEEWLALELSVVHPEAIEINREISGLEAEWTIPWD